MCCKIRKIKKITFFQRMGIQFVFMGNIKIPQNKKNEKHAYKEFQLKLKTLQGKVGGRK